MPIEYRDRTEILRRQHANGDITITRAVCVQTWDGEIVTRFGTRYLVEQGEWMIPATHLDRAEEIANEINTGARTLGDTAEEAAQNDR